MYWRLQRYFPHDDRFNYNNFAQQPTWLVLQAIEYGSKLAEESYHYHELGVSTLSSIMVNINRDPKSKATEPKDFQYFMRSVKTLLNSAVCDCFDSLARDRLIPDWVMELMPDELMDEMIKNRKFDQVRGSRFLYGDSIAFIKPGIRNDRASIPLGFLGLIEDGIYEVKDIDSGDRYSVLIEIESDLQGEPHAFIDQCFDISLIEED